MAPRPKEFDIDIALDRALEVFWSHGYEATSLSQLVTAMGIGRQSLYDTFGDKRQLFLAALDRFQAKSKEMLAPLLAEGAGLKALRDHLRGMAKQYGQEKASCRACLASNTAMELGQSDPEAAKRVQSMTQGLEKAILHTLNNAVADGDLAADTPVRARARMLVATIFGLGVYAKSGAPKQALLDAVDSALATL